MEEASSKYLVGQVTSPISNPAQKICASIRSVRELIEFPLTHDILEKNTDVLYPEKELNRIAYLRRAKELLNI